MECVNLMQTNVFDVLQKISNKNPLFANQDFVESSLENWREELRASAFIFGDSYKGMSENDVRELVEGEDFEIYFDETAGHLKILGYRHKYLNIELAVEIAHGKLDLMTLEFKLRIDMNNITDKSMCGVGMLMMQANSDGVMVGKMNVTGGFLNKIYVLKSFVTADQFDES